MSTPRDTYRYQLWHSGKVVHHGITNDPDRRQSEHRERWPGCQLRVVGPAVSRETGLAWEKDQTKSITPDPRKK